MSASAVVNASQDLYSPPRSGDTAPACRGPQRYQPRDSPGFCGLQDHFGAADYLDYLHTRPHAIGALALTVSLPDAALGDASILTYLDLLQHEVDLLARCHGRERPVTHLRWGGGNPLPLGAPELTELMHAIASRFRLLSGPERHYSVDLHAWQTTPELLALLKGLGFNQLTFEVTGADASLADAVDIARSFGYSQLHVNLAEELADGHGVLRDACALAVPRITLHHVDSAAAALLAAAGYRYIGAGVFARPDDPLAAALTHSRVHLSQLGLSAGPAPDLIGAGLGASGEVGACQTRNHHRLDRYTRALENGQLPIACGRILDSAALARCALLRAQALHGVTCGPQWRTPQ